MITFNKIAKKYQERTVLKDITFTIKQNTITILLGPNGAGKSTLARILLRLTMPSSGSIIYKGNVTMGYVPQRAALSATMPMSCSDFLELMRGDVARMIQTGLICNRKWQQIRRLQLTDISGGQLQRLMLAISIAQRPDLLVLDEPLTHLDLDSQEQFYQSLLYAKSRGITIFMISHDLHNVFGCADQVVCLNHHVCCTGAPKDPDGIFTLYQHTHNHKH